MSNEPEPTVLHPNPNNLELNDLEPADEEPPPPPPFPFTWTSKILKGLNISARGGHTMIHYENKLYLFAGAEMVRCLNEVYEVELDSISDDTLVGKLLPISTFPLLYEFASAVSGKKLWIFGGADKEESKNDVYNFDLESLENECPVVKSARADAPAPRTQCGNKTLIEINGSNNMVIFGGGYGHEEDIAVDDRNLHLFNVDTRQWSKVDTAGVPPTTRQGHVMVSIGQKLYMHGGVGVGELYDEIYSVDLSPKSQKRWVEVECQTKPCPRAAHNVVAVSDDFYIFGGFDSEGDPLNDLWKFDTKTLTWAQLHYSGKVSPRMGFAMCAISTENRTKLLIHGGFNTDGDFYSDFVEFSPIEKIPEPEDQAPTPLPSPPPPTV